MIRPMSAPHLTAVTSLFLVLLTGAAFGSFGFAKSGNAAEVIIAHDGDHEPNIEEGWQTIGAATGNVTFGPVLDSGSPSWFVRDFDSVGGSNYRYHHTFPADELCGLSSGWTLRAELRLPSEQNTNAIVLEVSDGERRYLTTFNRTGTTTRATMGGDVATAPLSDYNTYEMAFDPILEEASLWVNGVLAIDEYEGVPAGTIEPRVNWGSGSSSGQGEAYFRLVEFEMTPDPNTTVLSEPVDTDTIRNGIVFPFGGDVLTAATVNFSHRGFIEFPLPANPNRIIFGASTGNDSVTPFVRQRGFQLQTYAGDGSITLSDWDAGGPTVANRESNSPNIGTPALFYPYSIDITDEVDALIASNASHLGVSLRPTEGEARTAMAQLVACPEPSFAVGLGLGLLALASAGRRRV